MEDFFYKYISIYQNLPYTLKRGIGRIYNLLPRPIRYGRFYKVYHKRINNFQQQKDIGDMVDLQRKLLFEQVNKSINSVKYYKKYHRCMAIEDFQNYPVINKKIINDNFSDFLNPSYSDKRIKTNTGGSSGNPMELYLEKYISRSKEKAHFDWYWKQFNYSPQDKILMIRGLPLRNNRTFEYNSIDNILNISCYNINETTILEILNEINKFKPQFIQAYPSSLKVVAILLEPHIEKINLDIKAIFLGSEQLIDTDRDYFSKFFNTKVVNWYGHTERLIHGGNCMYSDDFHFYPFYGYIELLDEDNLPIVGAGKVGKIVASGFDNNAMPLIRYDTGDLGELSEDNICSCGFEGFSLRKINGRGQDFVLLSDNTKVSITAFIFGQHLESFKNIIEMQVIQNKVGEINIDIVRSSNFSTRDENSLIDTLLKSVNFKLQIKIRYVSHIPKTHRGKHIFFKSLLMQEV